MTASQAEPVPRLVRSDALPEHVSYRDDGCEVAPKCVKCPLPVCRYDVQGGARAIRNLQRDSEIARLRADGVPIAFLADRFRLSRRSVFRVLALAGDNGGPPQSLQLHVVAANGKESVMTESTESAERDPFEQLVDATRQVLSRLEASADRHEVTGKTRRQQASKVARALRALTANGRAGQTGQEQPPSRAPGRCPECGKHYGRWHRKNEPCPNPQAPETAVSDESQEDEAPGMTSGANRCPRCRGALTDDDGDQVCIACGHRVVGDQFGALLAARD